MLLMTDFIFLGGFMHGYFGFQLVSSGWYICCACFIAVGLAIGMALLYCGMDEYCNYEFNTIDGLSTKWCSCGQSRACEWSPV